MVVIYGWVTRSDVLYSEAFCERLNRKRDQQLCYSIQEESASLRNDFLKFFYTKMCNKSDLLMILYSELLIVNIQDR